MEMVLKFLKFILKVFLYLFAGLGALVFLSVLLLGILGYKAIDEFSAKVSDFEQEIEMGFVGPGSHKIKEIPETAILRVDLTKMIVDKRQFTPVQFLSANQSIVLHDLISTIDSAAKDDRVKAIYAEIGGDHIGIANIQEIRDAIIRFNKTGKTSLIYSSSIGEGGSGTQSYYLSSAFSEIWLQPIGVVNLIGMMTATPFARGTLDKIGIVPDIYHRGQYKSAPNTYTEYDFTVEQKEMMQDILQNIMDQELKDLKLARPEIASRTYNLYHDGPYLAQQALDKKLIDHIGYENEAKKYLKDKVGEKAKFLDFKQYRALRLQKTYNKNTPKVAIITAEGAIVADQSAQPAYQKDTVNPKALKGQFRRAAKDKTIKAVIFRVNSPGGSPVASEAIRHQLLEFKKTGKPIIVSMGNYGASGGYWIAMDGDKIIAQPATLTGSIGVFSGKFATEGFWKKLGITWGLIGIGDNSAFFSHLKPYNDTEKSRLDEQLDYIYQLFVKNVATARNMTESKVSLYAEGRVWTGEEALKIGFVDALGGFDIAKSELFKLLNVSEPEQAKFMFIDMEPRPNPFSFFIDFLNMQMKGQQIVNTIWPALPLTRFLNRFHHPGSNLQVDVIL